MEKLRPVEQRERWLWAYLRPQLIGIEQLRAVVLLAASLTELVDRLEQRYRVVNYSLSLSFRLFRRRVFLGLSLLLFALLALLTLVFLALFFGLLFSADCFGFLFFAGDANYFLLLPGGRFLLQIIGGRIPIGRRFGRRIDFPQICFSGKGGNLANRQKQKRENCGFCYFCHWRTPAMVVKSAAERRFRLFSINQAIY